MRTARLSRSTDMPKAVCDEVNTGLCGQDFSSAVLAWRFENVVGSFLRLGCGMNDPAFCVLGLQSFDPALQISGGIFNLALDDPGMGTKKSRAHFRYQLFFGVNLPCFARRIDPLILKQ
jgi:hypothetical protein